MWDDDSLRGPEDFINERESREYSNRSVRSGPAERDSYWPAHGGVQTVAEEIEEFCGYAFSACGIVWGTELVGLEQLLEQLLERGSR